MNNDYLVREFGKVTFFNNSVNYEEIELKFGMKTNFEPLS